MWPLDVGQVYTTLQRLDRDGLVQSDDDAEPGPQRGFRITAEGTQELDGWLLLAACKRGLAAVVVTHVARQPLD